MKKVIIILSAIAALFFSIWGYTSLKASSISKKTDIYTSIPEIPVALLQINNISELTNSLLYNNNYWLDLAKLESIGKVHSIFSKVDSLKDISQKFKEFIGERELVVSFYTDTVGNTQQLFSAKISKNDWSLMQKEILPTLLQPNKTTTTTAEGSKIIIYSTLQGKFYCCYANNIFVGSKNKNLLLRSIKQIDSEKSLLNSESSFLAVREISGKNAFANLFVNVKRLQPLTKKWFNTEAKRLFEITNFYADWCGFDINFSEEKIVVNGFSGANKNGNLIQLFNNQTPGENSLVKVIPQRTFFFNYMYLSDFEAFENNLDNFLTKKGRLQEKSDLSTKLETSTGESPYLFFKNHFNNEIAFGYVPFTRNMEDNTFVIAKLKDEQEAVIRLNRMATESEPKAEIQKFQGNIDIIKLNGNGFAGCVFGNTFTLANEYLAIYKQCLYIAPTKNLLIYLISQAQVKRTINGSENYQRAYKTLQSQSNNSIYADIPAIVRNADSIFTPEKAAWVKSTKSLWNNFQTFAVQSESEKKDISYQHIFVQYNKKTDIDKLNEKKTDLLAENSSENTALPTGAKNTQSVISEEKPTTTAQPNAKTEKESRTTKVWEIALETPIATVPQIVTNHKTGENEIAVQDMANKLYLISSEGKILWKLPLKERIMSDIFQVDLYRNKKLQLVFNTKTKLYVIDRTGKSITNFPVRLKSKASAGMTVFDYDNNREYRFFIPCENNQVILMKKDGSIPSDWNFKSGSGKITSPLQFFRIAGKDFLVASNNKKTYFLNRKGAERLTPQANVVKSPRNNYYTEKTMSLERFVTTDKSGNLCFVNLDNKVHKISVKKWSANHYFATITEKGKPRFIFLENKNLSIYNEEYSAIFTEKDIQTKSPFFMINNNWLALLNEKNSNLFLLDINTKKTINSNIKMDKNLFYIGKLKPYKQTCIIVSEKNKIVNYMVK